MWKAKIIVFAHALDRADHSFIWPILIVIGLICWVVGFLLALKAQRNRKPNVKIYYPPAYFTAVTIFLAVIFSGFVIGYFIKWAAFQEIEPRLFARVTAVTVDGKRLRDFTAFVASLREIHEPIGHHSHPTKLVRVNLTTASGPLKLNLERDSGVSSEYWVSNPSFYGGYVGRIETNALDGF